MIRLGKNCLVLNTLMDMLREYLVYLSEGIRKYYR